jgi:RNA polymerase sigma-70 factor (ECF subfamily)
MWVTIDLAEDALQDAFVIALDRWPGDGVPDQPASWIIQTARRKAIDQIRRRRNFVSKRTLMAEELSALNAAEAYQEEDESFPDERLRLIFTCCHPGLRQDAQVALTLKTVAGLTTAEIAHAFLVSDTTMAHGVNCNNTLSI